MAFAIVVLVVLALAAVALSILWRIAAATCRKLGMTETTQFSVATVVSLIPIMVLIAFQIDTLDDLETTCKSELLKSPRMAGTTRMLVERHYDYWKNTYSGSFVYPWISEPHQDPKVVLKIHFTREERDFSAWVDCHFDKLSDTGDPPALAFQRLNFTEDYINEEGRLAPWNSKRTPLSPK